MPKKGHADWTGVQAKLELVNECIHPSLRRVYHEIAPKLREDFRRFILHARRGDEADYKDAKEALDGLLYSKGLEVVVSARHEKQEQSSFSYQFICHRGFEFYQREYSAATTHVSALTSASLQSAIEMAENEPSYDATAVTGDLVVRAENPLNLEFWVSGVPYLDGRNSIKRGKDNEGSTYSSLFRHSLERRYSLEGTLMLEAFDYAKKFVEMDQLKHAIDGMEDLGLDDMLEFCIRRYLEEYLALVKQFLPASTTSLCTAVPGPTRTSAARHREAAHAALGRPVVHKRPPQIQRRMYDTSGYDMFFSPPPHQAFDVFAPPMMAPERIVDNNNDRNNDHGSQPFTWQLSRFTTGLLQGLT